MRILQLKERAKRWGGEVGENGRASSARSRTTQRPDRELYKVGGRKEVPAAQGSGEQRREREMKRRKSRSKTPEENERIRDPDKERRRHRKRSRSVERRRSRSRSRKHREHRSERRRGEKDRDGDRHRDRDRERGNDKSSDKKDHSSDKPPRERRHRLSPLLNRQDDSDADTDRSSRKRRKVEERTFDRASFDPLDEIIGPAPPPPPSRTRGRGTTSGSSAMDARFSEKYDPSMDVRPDSDDGDDWDNAVEAHRDRQKWKALGAERLRSAGFEEDYITAWENNDTKNTANIKWAKGGVREWDRGKVVEEETGEVSVRASWVKGESGRQEGRLNGREEGRLSGWEEGRLNGWEEGRLNGGGEDLY